MKKILIAALSVLTTGCGIYQIRTARLGYSTDRQPLPFRRRSRHSLVHRLVGMGGTVHRPVSPVAYTPWPGGQHRPADSCLACQGSTGHPDVVQASLPAIPAARPARKSLQLRRKQDAEDLLAGRFCLVGNRPLRKANQRQTRRPCRPARKRGLPAGYADTSHSHRSRQLLCPADARRTGKSHHANSRKLA